MRCFEKNIAPHVFGDVLEKVKHRTNDASNDVSRPALIVLPKMHMVHWQDRCSCEKGQTNIPYSWKSVPLPPKYAL